MADHPKQAVTLARRDSGIFTASVPIWQHRRALPADIRRCCGRVNRGLALTCACAMPVQNRKQHEDKSKLQSLEETRQSLMPVYDPKMLPEKDLRWCFSPLMIRRRNCFTRRRGSSATFSAPRRRSLKGPLVLRQRVLPER
jgi:hypothetical protein